MIDKSNGYTRGPWIAHPYNVRMGSLISFGYLSKGENIANVFGQKDAEEGKANARLIAASPELLEALIEAEKFVDRHTEEWYSAGQELLTKIRAAIRKAEAPHVD
jgi:hypothetical protein